MTTLFEGGGWKVFLDKASIPDGRAKEAVRVQRADSVNIIAFSDETHILLLREFRPFYNEYIWQLPGGRVDKENDIEEAARRELQEEAGFDAKRLEYFCEGNYSEAVLSTSYTFIARDLIKSSLPQDDDELIEVHEFTLEEAIEKVLGSPKVPMQSVYALLRYLRSSKARQLES